MVKRVIMNLDLSKASGPDCIPVVVLKNCEPKLSYILAELFNKCLRSLLFQIVGSFHQWLFKIPEERSAAKNYCPVSLLSVVCNVFLAFFCFPLWFRSSRSQADLLTVVSDRIARAFNRSGAT